MLVARLGVVMNGSGHEMQRMLFAFTIASELPFVLPSEQQHYFAKAQLTCTAHTHAHLLQHKEMAGAEPPPTWHTPGMHLPGGLSP
jgi:hypothetical protein